MPRATKRRLKYLSHKVKAEREVSDELRQARDLAQLFKKTLESIAQSNAAPAETLCGMARTTLKAYEAQQILKGSNVHHGIRSKGPRGLNQP